METDFSIKVQDAEILFNGNRVKKTYTKET